MLSASIALSLLVLAVAPAQAPAPRPAEAAPAEGVPAARDGRGLPTPTEEAWGDEWFDDDAPRAAALEQQRIVEAEAEALARAREEAAARAAADPGDTAPAGPEARPIVPPAATFADLDDAWERRRAALLRQDRDAAAREEARLLALRTELDVPEVHAFAGAAVRESRAHEEVSGEEAVARAELAVALGPSLPGTHFQLARARLRWAPAEVGGWVGPFADGVRTLATEPRWFRPILADLVVAALVGLLAAGGVVLLLLAIRHGRLVLHDFHHLFPRAATQAQTAALAAVLVLAPVVLGLGPLAAAAVLVLAVWLHLARAERVIVGAWLATLGLAPLLAGPLAGLIAWTATDQGVWSLERAGDFSALPALERRAGDPEAEPEVLFAVARATKRSGGLAAAAALYERALAARPAWPAALVNLGNVRFLEGKHDEALSLYSRAIAARPTLAAAYFDLSRLHYRRLDFAPGAEARTRALELDRTLVGRYAEGERDESPRANLYLLDVPLEAAGRLGGLPAGDAALLSAQAAGLLLGPLPASAAPWAVAGLLSALAGLGALARGRVSRSCAKCGRPACRRCDPEVRGEGGLCAQCVHVYARKEPVEPADRVQKEIAVQRHAARRRRARRALAFVLASHVVSGRVVRGAVLLAVAAALVWLVVLPQGLVRPAAFGPPVLLRLALAVPLLAAVWTLGVRDALGREG